MTRRARALTAADIEDLTGLLKLSGDGAVLEILCWAAGSDKRRRRLAAKEFALAGNRAGVEIGRTLIRCRMTPERQLQALVAIEQLAVPPTPELELALEIMARSETPQIRSRAALLAAKMVQTDLAPQSGTPVAS
jgi:hypothetical protein